MSSSLAAPVTSTTTTAATTTPTPTIPSASQNSHLAASRATNAAAPNSALLPHPIPSQFREIHKNTWLKRLTAEGKKITVGAKKSERSWVVFCVHDDTIALLEGYAEPRLTGAHMPEWIISLQDTLHISHGLIPNSHEFEFVVTLSNEVVRFHAMSWDIMQEWVTTLRSKLREMKIISPRENLYTKLPEVRAPLLPTRDPTSPLPAPPPVPAAIVPGVERVIPQSTTTLQPETTTRSISTLTSTTIDNVRTSTTPTTSSIPTITASSASTLQSNSEIINASSSSTANSALLSHSLTPMTSTSSFSSSTPNITAMSNTLTQNLLNMLSDPISAYSEQINDSTSSANDIDSCSEDLNFSDDEFLSPILRKSCAQLLQSDSIRFDVGLGQQRASADHIKNLENLLQCERLIPRPQTSRSQSVGAADKSKKMQDLQRTSHSNDFGKANTSNNVQKNNKTDLEISNGTKNTNLININENDNENNTSTTTTVKAAVAATEAAPEASTTTTADTETNITIIQVSTNVENNDIIEDNMPPELLPKKTITADIFKFPEAIAARTTTSIGSILTGKQHEYKSNVQIIPSNTNSSTIQVLTQDLVTTTKATATNTNTNTTTNTNIKTTPTNTNQYSSAIKKAVFPIIPQTATSTSNTTIFSTPTVMHTTENHKVTTLHVAGSESAEATTSAPISTSVAIYGTCYTSPAAASSSSSTSTSTITANKQQTSTPKLPKKIILTANSSGITNITVNNNDNRNAGNADNIISLASITRQNSSSNLHYEKVFLSSNIPIASTETQNTNTIIQPMPNKLATQWQSPRHQTTAASSSNSSSSAPIDAVPSSPRIGANTKLLKIPKSPLLPVKTIKANNKVSSPSHSVSPAMQRRRIVSPPNVRSPQTINQQQNPAQHSAGRHPFLTRGLTEAAIMTRPSRKDLYNMKLANTSLKTAAKITTAISNNNDESIVVPRSSTNMHHQQPLLHSIVNRTNSELIEQRRRSSSTSDAQAQRTKASQITTHSANNNELNSAHGRAASNGLRIQQPPLPFRSVENGSGAPITTPNSANNSPGGKRMTLREQQVMQLRREIMHPGGVRLQLRRKDCVGSIAWVDAFGAVWVAGWKQKEHPVLYNALHIGDQLISIAGININTAAEANKIIRNTNTLFVEVLVRRIPFGRGYAIRREREGQCLGLIRDGNTATIVDVVPNSLAARHGLPPKAQSCDGTTLTFWVLTEINGRPLNLFFKENEIRDRLNSVGRDISILVQPSDLITKLKKQLKSLRGYKDYLVQ